MPITRRRLLGGQLLEVAEHEHLAVDRIECIERFLKPELPLGTGRGDAGPGIVAQELRGQGRRRGARDRPSLDPHLARGVAGTDAQVLPVERLEGHSREPAEPEVERQLRPLQVLWQCPHSLKARLLEDVGWVDPAHQPAIEPQGDHPAQPVSVPPQQLGPGRLVALARPAEPLRVIR